MSKTGSGNRPLGGKLPRKQEKALQEADEKFLSLAAPECQGITARQARASPFVFSLAKHLPVSARTA